MSTIPLPLSEIIPITVQVSGIAASAPTFNQGLIAGSTVAAGYAAANTRILQFAQGNWSQAMLAAGFTTSSPEYLAMQDYFSALVPPLYGFVGLQNPSSLNTVIPHSGAAGTNYSLGDVVAVTQAGASGGQLTVSAVGSGGSVTALVVVALADGTGYSTATALATTNVTVQNPAATGLEVDITAIGETPLACITYLRSLNYVWYGCMSTKAVDADHEAIASFAQGSSTPMKYYWSSATAAVPGSPYTSSSSDVASYMKANSLSRSVGLYSTTQGGLYPNNVYSAAAWMGMEMGLNTGFAGSYYTSAFKTLVGVATEPLNQQQVNNVLSKNCNLYSNYQNSFSWTYPGVTGRTGWYSDLVTFLDVLTAQVQFNIANVLNDAGAIPMTDAGEQLLIHAVNQACQNLVAVGFIQPGVWEGVTIQLATPSGTPIGITPGTALTSGFVAFAQPFAMQTAAANTARQAMPIYVCLIAPGAIQYVAVELSVLA